jgi:hypothetical protein
MKTMAIERKPSLRAAASSRRTIASSSGVTISPFAATRSSTSTTFL